MCQLILRFNNCSKDVDVLIEKEGEITEKVISISDCMNVMQSELNIEKKESFYLDNFDENLIAFNRHNNMDQYLCKLPERKILCSYKEKTYSVMHPNVLFLMTVDNCKNIMTNVTVFIYKIYKGEATVLYNYPFPNMLGGGRICSGTITKDVKNPIDTFLNIVEGNYTHDHSETKHEGFYNTIDFFLKNKTEFHYEICTKANITINVLKEQMRG